MTERLRQLRVSSIDLVDLGEAVGARITLAKRREDGASAPLSPVTPPRDAVAKEGTKTMTFEQILAELGPEKAKVITDAMAACKAGTPEPKPDPMAEAMKALPADVQKRLAEAEDLRKREAARVEAEAKAQRDEVEKQRKQAEEKAEELRQEVAKLREAETDREYVAKARKLTGDIGLPKLEHGDVAAILKSLDRKQPIPEAVAKKLGESLAAIPAILGEAEVFKERGSTRGGPPASGAEGELQEIAKRLREQNPKLDKFAALAQAARDNPEIYRRSQAERA